MQHLILWIEGRRVRTPPLASQLRKKGCQVFAVPTGRYTLEEVVDGNPAVAVVNAASMGASGARILGSLRGGLGSTPILLIRTIRGVGYRPDAQEYP